MRHGLTVVLVTLGLGLFSFPRAGVSSELFEERLGLRIQPIFLLTRVDIQADLKLSPDQIADASRAGDELYRKAQMLRGKKGPAIDQERRKVDEELTEWLHARLTLSQLERLRQIDLQWQGAAAMVHPIVAEYLALTPEQTQTVSQYLAESERQRARSRWTAIDHFQLTRKAVAILSDKQKELWSDLLGRPCQFANPAPRQAGSDRGLDNRQQPGR